MCVGSLFCEKIQRGPNTKFKCILPCVSTVILSDGFLSCNASAFLHQMNTSVLYPNDSLLCQKQKNKGPITKALSQLLYALP